MGIGAGVDLGIGTRGEGVVVSRRMGLHNRVAVGMILGTGHPGQPRRLGNLGLACGIPLGFEPRSAHRNRWRNSDRVFEESGGVGCYVSRNPNNRTRRWFKPAGQVRGCPLPSRMRTARSVKMGHVPGSPLPHPFRSSSEGDKGTGYQSAQQTGHRCRS